MFYLAVFAFLLGVTTATLLPFSLATTLLPAVIACGLALVSSRATRANHQYFIKATALILLFLSIGLLRTVWHSETLSEPSPFDSQVNMEILFSGTVIAEPDERARTTQLHVRSAGEKILVSIDRHHDVSYGDEVIVSGTLELPEAFTTDLGRTFDYPGYLLARGITYRVSFADVVVIAEGAGNPFIAFLLREKHRLLNGIESVIPEPESGLAAGLLLGVKQALGAEVEEAFRRSGIIHIVVLSGYNVMLVVAFFMFFLRPLPRLPRLVLGLLAISSFALLVGLSATVVRASIMAGLFLIASEFAKTYNVLRILFIAGIIMVFVNPYLLLFDIGFQLSFMATLGLILIAPYIETTVLGGRWLGVKEFFVATVATQIAVLPLLLYHIGEFSLVAVAVNMIVLPVVPFAMFGAFIAGVSALIAPTIALLAAYPTSYLLGFIIIVAEYFAALPFATVIAPAFSPWLVPLMYLLMGALVHFYPRLTSRESDELRDWNIVEEETLLASIESMSPEPKSSSDTPIFFR